MKDWHLFYITTVLFPIVSLFVWAGFGIPYEVARWDAALGTIFWLAMTLMAWARKAGKGF